MFVSEALPDDNHGRNGPAENYHSHSIHQSKKFETDFESAASKDTLAGRTGPQRFR